MSAATVGTLHHVELWLPAIDRPLIVTRTRVARVSRRARCAAG